MSRAICRDSQITYSTYFRRSTIAKFSVAKDLSLQGCDEPFESEEPKSADGALLQFYVFLELLSRIQDDEN